MTGDRNCEADLSRLKTSIGIVLEDYAKRVKDSGCVDDETMHGYAKMLYKAAKPEPAPGETKAGADCEAMERRAYDMAREYFKDMTDKGGHPYMEHIESVWTAVSAECDRNTRTKHSALWVYYKKCCITALLHDILEDTPCTADDLRRNGFDDEVVDAVLAMTRKPDETYYFDYILRVSDNDIARKVKVHDLENNMDATRLESMGDADAARIVRYWWCRCYLLGKVSGAECNNAIHPDRKFR